MQSRSKSQGRKSIQTSLTPRELVSPTPRLAGVWQAQVLTLFPELFPGALEASVTGRGLREGLWQLHTLDLRAYGKGRHRNVDDTPAGGGPGMILRPDVVGDALTQAKREMPPGTPLLCMSARGRPFTQSMAGELAQGKGAIVLCGRFEGIDERVIEHFGITEISIGDYVLTGGELAAQVLIDAVVRLIPSVLGNAASVQAESFSQGLLEHPQYTRPALWQGREIPKVLLSGNHGQIERWRRQEAERITRERRPDLWRRRQRNAPDKTR